MSFWVGQLLLSFTFLNELFFSPDGKVFGNAHMVTQAIGIFCLVFTTGVVMTFLATRRTNDFLFVCIQAMTTLLALETPKWVWDKNTQLHTMVSNFQILGRKGL